jgi:hypothetical protein
VQHQHQQQPRIQTGMNRIEYEHAVRKAKAARAWKNQDPTDPAARLAFELEVRSFFFLQWKVQEKAPPLCGGHLSTKDLLETLDNFLLGHHPLPRNHIAWAIHIFQPRLNS